MEIIYRDESLIISEKPAGLLSVPGRGPEKADCHYSRLAEKIPDLRVVHRLDQATSGLMVWAVGIEVQRNLSRQFEKRLVKKAYEALVLGVLPGKSGRISLKQRLDPDNRPRQIIDPELGKEGVTDWDFTGVDPHGLQRVRLYPQTGRTHQLRLHLSFLNCPIAGDTLYGEGGDDRFGRMCLHACFLEFIHPLSGEKMAFRSKVPF